jgi:biopolymer transport protein TolQ
LTLPSSVFAFLQVSIWELVRSSAPIPMAVLVLLLVISVISWAIIFSKWNSFRQARTANLRFLRAFRKANALEAVALAAEQFPNAPMVAVFDYGYEEFDRQMKTRGKLVNPTALERSLQIGTSEEVAKLERNMNWLATAASVSPFIGLFGTVMGIIDAFQALGVSGSVSLRVVAPGIAHALVATAVGLAAAIPAAIFYNHFGHVVKEIGTRMEDFCMEFLNQAEKSAGG